MISTATQALDDMCAMLVVTLLLMCLSAFWCISCPVQCGSAR